MGAADEIRAGVLAKFEALESAGLNNHTVVIFTKVDATGEKRYAGKGGSERIHRLTLKPNPQVVLSRKTVATSNGFEDESHARLEGAFPSKLSGEEFISTDGEETSSAPVEKTFADHREFRVYLEKADYFTIDGELYKYRGDGFLNVNKTETEWSLRLVKG